MNTKPTITQSIHLSYIITLLNTYHYENFKCLGGTKTVKEGKT